MPRLCCADPPFALKWGNGPGSVLTETQEAISLLPLPGRNRGHTGFSEQPAAATTTIGRRGIPLVVVISIRLPISLVLLLELRRRL
jgi:hypothetical protein